MKCYIKDYPAHSWSERTGKSEREVEILVWGRGAAAGPGDHSTVYV